MENEIIVGVKKNKNLKLFINICTIIGTLLLIFFIYYGIIFGIFSSEEKLSEFLSKVGIWGPIIFIVIQIVQVVIPIIPGGVSCVVGVLVFGPFFGFIYNYVSIIAGSIIVFLISKKYGMPLLRKMFKKELIEKYVNWLDKGKKFDKLFAIAIFMPVAPDDFLCYLAGLTKMSLKKYTIILILCKPASILAYSLGLAYLTSFLLK